MPYMPADPLGTIDWRDVEPQEPLPVKPLAEIPMAYPSFGELCRDLRVEPERLGAAPYILPSDDYPGGLYPQWKGPGHPWPVDVWTGNPLVPGKPELGYVEPRTYLPVCFRQMAPAAYKVDSTGVPLKWRWRQFLYLLYHACGVCAVEIPPAQYKRAWWLFDYRTGPEVVALSKRWQAGYGSGYWAVCTDSPEWAGRWFCIGDRRKPEQGGGPVGGINAIRFPARALAYSLLGQTSNTFAYGDSTPIVSFGHPYMSGPLTQPYYGKTADELRRLSAWGGRAISFRYGTKGVEADRPLKG